MRKIITYNNNEYLTNEISYDDLFDNIRQYNDIIITINVNNDDEVILTAPINKKNITAQAWVGINILKIDPANIKITNKTYNITVNESTLNIYDFNDKTHHFKNITIIEMLNILNKYNNQLIDNISIFNDSMVFSHYYIINNVKKFMGDYKITLSSIKYHIPIKLINTHETTNNI